MTFIYLKHYKGQNEHNRKYHLVVAVGVASTTKTIPCYGD